MWQLAGSVGIGMEVIAGKFVAIATKFQALALRAFIGRTTMLFAEDMLLKGYLTIVISAPVAKQYFNRHVVFLRYLLNCFHCLLVLVG
jgi:hypothetical protein